jgi:hypothetical protein
MSANMKRKNAAPRPIEIRGDMKMRFWVWLAPLSALAFAGCSESQSVEKPYAEAFAALTSMPGDADAMSLATRFPGTSFYIEPTDHKVIWHFVRDGTGEYARYVAELSEDGPNKTTVSTHLEDGPADSNLSFLDTVAKIAGDASVTAALHGTAVDRSAIQQQIAQEMIKNPLASQITTIETVSDEMKKQAPADSCKTGTPKEQSSWVCQKHGSDINGDTGVITDAETGEVTGHQ